MLAILIPEHQSLPCPHPFSIRADFFVEVLALEAREGAEAGVSAAFLGDLRGTVHPAELVGVFPRIGGHTGALKSAEDVIWTEVLVEFNLQIITLALLVVDGILRVMHCFTCGLDDLRFACGGGVVGEDTVIDEEDASVAELGVDPVANGFGEVGFDAIHCELESQRCLRGGTKDD
jgi:hypothetical protein